jgi:hypothetical protein
MNCSCVFRYELDISKYVYSQGQPDHGHVNGPSHGDVPGATDLDLAAVAMLEQANGPATIRAERYGGR